MAIEVLNIKCSRMSYEEFQSKVIESVRSLNHLDLVDTWEKHIIYKDFSESIICNMQSYHATVYFAEECHTNEPSIRIYEFSYFETYGDNESANFLSKQHSIYSEEIEVIRKFAQCFNTNKGWYFGCILDDFHKAE